MRELRETNDTLIPINHSWTLNDIFPKINIDSTGKIPSLTSWQSFEGRVSG
jgi:hypothetical protein